MRMGNKASNQKIRTSLRVGSAHVLTVMGMLTTVSPMTVAPLVVLT